MSTLKSKFLLPEIIWDASPLLEDLLKPYAETNHIPVIPLDEIKQRLPLYKHEWEENGEEALSLICDRLQISFLEKTISVWVSGSIIGGRSIPLVVSSNKDPKDVFDLVIHELIHRLAYRNFEGWSYESTLKKVTDSKDRLFFNHVFVFAVHRYLIGETTNGEHRLERERQRTEKHPSYAKAWAFVEEYGYERLLDEIGSGIIH